MDMLHAARAVGGLLSIVVLLGMLVAQFIYPELKVSAQTITTLTLLIAGLLGIDMAMRKLPVSITIGERKTEDKD